MTNALTTAAMLAVMLLHAVFGCRWHHEQTSCALPSAIALVNTGGQHHDHGGCCSHDRDARVPPDGKTTPGDNDQPARQDGDHDCCEEDCQFLVPVKIGVPSERGDGQAIAATNQSAATMTARAEVSRLARADGFSWESGPSLRRLSQLCAWRV